LSYGTYSGKTERRTQAKKARSVKKQFGGDEPRSNYKTVRVSLSSGNGRGTLERKEPKKRVTGKEDPTARRERSTSRERPVWY